MIMQKCPSSELHHCNRSRRNSKVHYYDYDCDSCSACPKFEKLKEEPEMKLKMTDLTPAQIRRVRRCVKDGCGVNRICNWFGIQMRLFLEWRGKKGLCKK